jgi:hypothetical protein
MGILMLGGARSVVAQQPTGQVVRLGDGETLTISGFVSASWLMNSGLFVFGNGQNAEYAALVQPATDKTYLDGDVRNTRIRFEFAGSPVIGKWSPRAVIESDFFGALNGAPPFGDEQPQLRVRFAYADLTNGRTTLRIGQFWSPMFGEVPVSVTHIAFPLGYGAAGMIGWRYPGIFLYHDLAPGKPLAIQLQLAALEGSGPAGNASDVGTNTGIGEASGMPQLEGRLNFSKRRPNFSWSLYFVGHIDWKDTTGTGVAGNNLTGTGVEVGGNVTAGNLTVHGNFYTGKALGQQFAHITPTALNQQNVKGMGAWVQGGYEFNPHWSAWLFYGMDNPDEAQFATDNPGVVGGYLRHKNEDLAGMLRFRAGRYAVGVEYFKANTTWSTVKQKASQVSLSVLYTI